MNASNFTDSVASTQATKDLPANVVKFLTQLQQSMMTEGAAYKAMAKSVKDEANRETLFKISDEITDQAESWEAYTGKKLKPDQGKVRHYARVARILGFTFAVKYMDKKKVKLVTHCEDLIDHLPEIKQLTDDECKRDKQLFALLNEKRLSYVGAMILGMNDAIVEITGTLAGLTLAMQNTRIIALSGLVTGIAATLSMAASEYLAERTDGKPDAKKSALYTGVAYALTVVLLLIPYLALPDNFYLLAMGIMLVVVVLILAAFNFYTSVAQDLPFKKRFGQMCAISLGVAALTFILGLLVKVFLGVDV